MGWRDLYLFASLARLWETLRYTLIPVGRKTSEPPCWPPLDRSRQLGSAVVGRAQFGGVSLCLPSYPGLP